MFPIYGGVFFIILIIQTFFGDSNIIFRGIAYGLLIIIWEYITGFIVKKIVGVAPWDYSTDQTFDGVGSKKKFQLQGLICLEYLPIWAVEGLFAEYIYLFLKIHFKS